MQNEKQQLKTQSDVISKKVWSACVVLNFELLIGVFSFKF